MSDLVQSVSIDDLLNKRDAIIERLELMRKLHAEIDALSVQYFSKSKEHGQANFFVNGLNGSSNYKLYDVKNGLNIGLEKAVQCVDKAGWKHLLHESGMRTLMNSTMRDEWDELLYSENKSVPVLTRGTIAATFKTLQADSVSIFEQGVLDVFKALSWQYKTNLPQKFGKRIILNYVRSYRGRGSACDKLDDLCRVFSILDKDIVKDHRKTDGSELALLARAQFNGVKEFNYFIGKWFKNNNAHITFTRIDLVDELNRIIAKHYPNALPAPK